ncbi:MAG: nucleotidyltransferase domain-containing protein [Cyanobacteria bacterium P01_E01_bin.42]
MTQQIYQRLKVTPIALANFCKKWEIRELSAFGSVLRDDFNANSDIDLLVTFHPQSKITLFDFETIEIELKTLFLRDVDLVSKRAIERSQNWIRRQNILGNARVIYVTR